ncbi:SCL31 [Acrasis kona]|uniref:SCL31 n=1 Tax=Acrasis kona TaxID=1008807 RepID=A0AAW2YHQ4_9EUKA
MCMYCVSESRLRRFFTDADIKIQYYLSQENSCFYVPNGVQFVFRITSTYSRNVPELQVTTLGAGPVLYQAHMAVPTYVQLRPQQEAVQRMFNGIHYNKPVDSAYGGGRPILLSNNV